jgi:O-antigen/teichoic acid export membrane protein
MMLWRHGLVYLVARGLPGLISLLAIFVYTRLLLPEEYGRYALVIAGVGLANKLAFEWLRLSLLRFLPATHDPRVLFATLGAGFLCLVALSASIGAAALLFMSPDMRWMVGIGLALLWAQALFELELERARAQLAPKRYGRMALARAALGLMLGSGLAAIGFGAAAPLLGMIAATLIALMPPLLQTLREFRLALWDSRLMRQLLHYGAPLTVTAGLGFIIASSDRLLIGWLLDDAMVGRYAVSYDLTSFTIGLLLMIINLAAYPLALRALEDRGPEAARAQLNANLTALLAIGLPATIGLALLAEPVSEVLLGPDFSDQAMLLIPLVAVAALLRDFKAYYVDLAFYLGRNTLGQMWTAVAASLLSVMLNLWWIPAYGVSGAAATAIVTYLFAIVLSAWLGRSVFALPAPGMAEIKVLLAAFGMGGALWLVGPGTGPVGLISRIVFGALFYGLLLLLFDVAGSRAHLVAWIRSSASARGRE